MSTISSTREIALTDREPSAPRIGIALEVSLVYAGILSYIWRWQFSHPGLWLLILAAVLLGQLAHRDSLHALGLTTSELRASAQLILPFAVAVYAPLLLYGLMRHSLVLASPGTQSLAMLARYGTWCLAQQYLAQSYFHNRLMSVMPNPHRSSLLVALMFGAAHIPNPVLMVVTTIGGFCLAEAFARHRNIWPLALAQAVGGLLLAALVPASLIHNMRVGPGYFFYGLR